MRFLRCAPPPHLLLTCLQAQEEAEAYRIVATARESAIVLLQRCPRPAAVRVLRIRPRPTRTYVCSLLCRTVELWRGRCADLERGQLVAAQSASSKPPMPGRSTCANCGTDAYTKQELERQCSLDLAINTQHELARAQVWTARCQRLTCGLTGQ